MQPLFVHCVSTTGERKKGGFSRVVTSNVNLEDIFEIFELVLRKTCPIQL